MWYGPFSLRISCENVYPCAQPPKDNIFEPFHSLIQPLTVSVKNLPILSGLKVLSTAL